MLDYDKLEQLRELAVMPEDFDLMAWRAPRLDAVCYSESDKTDDELLADGSNEAKRELAKRDLEERCNLIPLINRYRELEAMKSGYVRGRRGDSAEQLGVRIQTGFAMSAGASWEDAVIDTVDTEREANKEELGMIYRRADVARKIQQLRKDHPRAKQALGVLKLFYLHGWRAEWGVPKLTEKLAEKALEKGLLLWANDIMGLGRTEESAEDPDWMDSDDGDRIG